MPVMNGEEATRAIRRHSETVNPDVKIVALTADVVAGVRERLLDSGMDDYLSKPIQIPELYRIVRKYLPQEKIIEDEEAAEEYKELADFMKETLGDKVEKVRISTRIKNHPVCFTAEGDVSIEMEKVFNAMPNANGQVKAKKVLELNSASPVVKKLNSMFENDKEKAKELTDVLYQMACIIEGMPVENPTAMTDAVCKLIAD